MSQQSIAIIGTGMSGLSLARMLEPNFEVTLFEKARGPGGRFASRRHQDMCFDFGVPFFRIRKKSSVIFCALISIKVYLRHGLLDSLKLKMIQYYESMSGVIPQNTGLALQV